MNTRSLGRTGMKVSEIGIGAWQLGGPLTLDGRPGGHPEIGAAHAIDLIRSAGDLGINFIDTAEEYGDGESERRVGKAIAGRRSEWIVSTKFGSFRGKNGERVEDASVARLPISLAASLRRMETDYVDVYLYHVQPKQSDLDEVVRFFEDAKRKGQVRAVGISSNDLEQVQRLSSYGLCDVVQFAQNLVEPATQLAQFVADNGIGGIVRGAFAGGRLSGKYFHAAPVFGPDDIRSVWFGSSDVAQTFGRYRVFEELVPPAGSMQQLALRFLLDQATTSVLLLGAKTMTEYREAIKATELPRITPYECERIEHLRTLIGPKDGGWLGSIRRLLRR